MNNYDLAWMVVVVAAILGAVGLYRLLPNLALRFRIPLVTAVFALFTLPAPVPRFDGEFAPAFIVFIFELLFQIDGQPNMAGGVLVIGGVVTLILTFIVMMLIERRAGAAD